MSAAGRTAKGSGRCRKSVALTVRQAGVPSCDGPIVGENSMGARHLPCVPSRDQARSVGQYLRPKRLPGRGFLGSRVN